MNLDDLKIEWRAEMEQAGPASDWRFDEIKKSVSELHRGVRFGNFWLVFAFLGVSAIDVFAQWVSLEGAGWMSKLGAVAWVVFAAWVAVVLRVSLNVNRSDDWTLRSRLQIEIERMEKQRSLWGNVGAWLLAPMLAVNLLVTLGGSHDRTGSYAPGLTGWVIYAVHVALFAFVYWFCRREVRRTIDPLVMRLKSLHRELVDG
jgi:hypothetical protein